LRCCSNRSISHVLLPARRAHSSKRAAAACGDRMGQTDRRTDARQLPRPRFACYMRVVPKILTQESIYCTLILVHARCSDGLLGACRHTEICADTVCFFIKQCCVDLSSWRLTTACQLRGVRRRSIIPQRRARLPSRVFNSGLIHPSIDCRSADMLMPVAPAGHT